MNLTCFPDSWLFQPQIALRLTCCVSWVPGRIGSWLRYWIYSSLFKQVGDRLQTMAGSLFRGVRQIEIGHFVQIDRQVQINAAAAALIRLNDFVNLGKQICLIATQQSSIVLSQAVVLKQGTELRASQASNIEIGQFTYVGSYCQFFSTSKIRIGENCHIGDRSVLRANPPSLAELLPSVQTEQPAQRGIVIEDDCWVGNNVTILAGVTVGRGSVINDDAVIADPVPPYSIVVGAPAKIVDGVLRDL